MFFKVRLLIAILFASAVSGHAVLAGTCAPQGADPGATVHKLYAAA